MKICFGCFGSYDDQFEICPHCGYTEGTEPGLGIYMRPGTILRERYVIGRALGHGGFSVTYLAWDALLRHKVAVKEYLPSEYATRQPGESRLTVFSGKPGEYFSFGKQKFLDEARRLSAFQNEDGVVHIYDCFSENETAYLVMEYLEGETLSEYLKQEGPLAPDEAVRLLTPVMISLQHIHDSGMIHRDIAPDNIMLLKDGGVRLIDFGAARHAVHDCGKSMTVIIKDGYSPEEQYSSHSVQGPSADVYALSATLYQMVTGVTPPNAMERGEALRSHRRDPLAPPSRYCKSITKSQEAAILNGMCLHTQDRTQSVAELYEELTAKTPVQRVQETIQKKEGFGWPLWAKLAAGAAAAAIVAGGILFFVSRRPKTDAAPDGSFVYSPNIVNLPVDEAAETAKTAQLQLVLEGSDYDAGVEKGRILTQDPASGTKLTPQSELNATASLGKERPLAVMADETDMLRDAALEHLTRLGLTEDQITWEYVKSDTEADGTIIDQSIDAGSALTDGSRLTLTVAENPAPAQTLPVPDTGAGGSAPGEVIDLPTLTPSEDSCVTVADFVGRAFDAAKQELRAQGVYAVKCELRYHPTIPSGSVILQSPAGGARVRKGDAVYFVVSLGPEKQIVPSVLYQPVEEAKRILALHGCGWTTQDVVNEYVKTGHVAAQTPEGGSQTLPPAQVALEISADKASAVQTPGAELTMPREMDLLVGETLDLGAELTVRGASGAASWYSSLPEIASVDENGVLTANAPGATTVTAVVDGAAAACCVAVSDGRPLQMSELVILDVGETVPLGGQLGGIEPELVRWVSRHPDVVRVDADGMATGVSEGWTYVTAVYDGRTAQCAVWVLDPANYIRVRRFDGSTTQQAAETALKDAGVSYTKKWVESTIAAGHISELLFTGYRDSDYYYISPNEPVELWISADAENTKEPEKEPEKQEPAKKESLSVSVLPDKRTFYSGDTLTTSGLKLQYTDKTGKTQTVSSGFQTTANMQAAGTKQVTVTYKGLTTSYSITVKKPSVKLQKEQIEGGIRLSATTDPAGQTVQWISLNPQIAYFEGSELRAAGAGTATIKASMVYNGVTYSDTTTITVLAEEKENYSFEIRRTETSTNGQFYKYFVNTNIPNFDSSKVTWWLEPVDERWYTEGGCAYLSYGITGTLTATYVHNGKTYTASCYQAAAVENYILDLFLVERTEGRAAYAIKTDIPGCTAGTATWTVASAQRGGWVDGSQYIVDEFGMENGESYTVTVSYTYNGKTYSASCTYTYTEQPSANVFPVIPDEIPTIQP